MKQNDEFKWKKKSSMVLNGSMISMVHTKVFPCCEVNLVTAKLFTLNFHPLEVVSR